MKIVQGTTNRDSGAGGNDTVIRVDTAASSFTTTWRGTGTGTKEREDDGIRQKIEGVCNSISTLFANDSSINY